MDKVSKIGAYTAPTLWVDIDDLRIPCAVPNLDMTEDLLRKAQLVVEDAGKRMTQEAYDRTFELFAAVLSCNHNFLPFTPDELKARRVTVTQIMGVLTDWVQFIGSLAQSKN